MSCMQDCEGYAVPRKKFMSKKDTFEPVKLRSEDTERMVEAALVRRGIFGGCWNTVMSGRAAGAERQPGQRLPHGPCVRALLHVAWHLSGHVYMHAACQHLDACTQHECACHTEWGSVRASLSQQTALPCTAFCSVQRSVAGAARCLAVAGLAAWFTSKAYKMASWLTFDNVLLRDDRPLTLGHCQVTAHRGCRSGVKPGCVVFMASADAPIWDTKVMWG